MPNKRIVLNASWLFLGFVLFFNSQLFNAAPNNPFGLRGVQEVFYFFLLVYAVYTIAKRLTTGSISRVDFYVFGLVLFMWLYSAAMSRFIFGQPLQYGLIEERRLLSFLVYFPLVAILRSSKITVENVFDTIFFMSIVFIILLISLFLGLITPLQEIDVGEAQLRQERYAVGHHYMSIAMIYSFSLLLMKVHRLRSSIYVLAGYLSLLIFVQTRQTIVAVTLAISSIVFRLESRALSHLLSLMALVGVGLLFMAQFLPEFIERYALLFQEATSDDYLRYSARSLSISHVFGHVSSIGILGSGSLSSLWEGGFSRIYGEYFFLTDIGLFGSLYKYGIFVIPVYATYFFIQTRIIFSIDDQFKKKIYLAIFIYLIAAFPFSAIIEYRGLVSGLLLALTVYDREISLLAKRCRNYG